MKTGSNLIMIKDADINSKNIIYKYVRLTVKEIRTHTMTYIVQKTRQVQNSVYMYH